MAIFDVTINTAAGVPVANLTGYTAIVMDPTDGTVMATVANPSVDGSGNLDEDFTRTTVASGGNANLLLFNTAFSM